MYTWMVWALAVPLIVIASSLLLLALGLLVTLSRTVSILRDIEDKLQALNPLCRLVHRLGEIAEDKVEEWSEPKPNPTRDIVDLIMWGISKFNKWRK